MNFIKMTDLNLKGKRVLIRSDLNVPIKDGKVTSDVRIRASLPTIESALKQGAYVMVASHLNRPIEGEYKTEFSLQPVVDDLKNKLSFPVHLVKNYLNGLNIPQGELVVLENVRFNKGEEKNDIALSKKYASLNDIFIMDAFGAAHRTEASTYGVIKFSPVACAGLLFSKELEELSKALSNPERPMVAIVGGSKVSTKLKILNSLSRIADQVIIGGAIINTFLLAAGYNIGASTYEINLIPEAKNLLQHCNIPMPTDIRVATEFSENATAILKSVNDIRDNEQILDLGDSSIDQIEKILKNAKTILWNGPVGVFEFTNFRKGTEMIAHTIANSKAFSVAGGGDTLAAINFFGVSDRISYISTGGGAFLDFIQGNPLPAVAMLQIRSKSVKK